MEMGFFRIDQAKETNEVLRTVCTDLTRQSASSWRRLQGQYAPRRGTSVVSYIVSRLEYEHLLGNKLVDLRGIRADCSDDFFGLSCELRVQ